MALGDVFKLVLNSHQGSVPFQNVFHYRQTFGVTGGNILAQEFINEVFQGIKNIVSDSVVFDSVEYFNYDDLSDFGVDTSIAGEVGVRPGDVLPSFNAWAFQYNRETRATRNGAKRFSSVAESDQNFGQPVSAIISTLEATADSLGQFINLGGTEVWQPIIARLSPDGATVLVQNDVKNVTFKRLTSQTTRKSPV